MSFSENLSIDPKTATIAGVGEFYVIVCDLPDTDFDGKPITDYSGNIIYKKNYFCRRLKAKGKNLYAIEWDTDFSYSQRFKRESGAENYRRIVLENPEGSRVEKRPQYETNI